MARGWARCYTSGEDTSRLVSGALCRDAAGPLSRAISATMTPIGSQPRLVDSFEPQQHSAIRCASIALLWMEIELDLCLVPLSVMLLSPPFRGYLCNHWVDGRDVLWIPDDAKVLRRRLKVSDHMQEAGRRGSAATLQRIKY